MGASFVILAAGRGTRIGRIGESLHKALVPLGGRAIISHLLDLAPRDAEVVVCLGHRAEQVRGYLALAHPNRPVRFIDVAGYDQPGSGPGTSLLAARDVVGDRDMVVTSCDTLWARDQSLWERTGSWAAIAPIPAGTAYARWCRMRQARRGVQIIDKRPGNGSGWNAYTGLARVDRRDLTRFWEGLEGSAALRAGERQVSGGLEAIGRHLELRSIVWTDVGDEVAYRTAVARWEGYDFTKPGEATYVLPEEGRVVKFWADGGVLARRARRAESLQGAVPGLLDEAGGMLAYRYTPGVTGYAATELFGTKLTQDLLTWAANRLWHPTFIYQAEAEQTALRFYRDKTMERVMQLESRPRDVVLDALNRVDWEELARGIRPGRFHGDFNLGNVIYGDGGFTAIDWREDFAGETAWGDMRYDVAKLLAGMVVHWDRAKTGDMRPWVPGAEHARLVRNWAFMANMHHGLETIAALSLLNSAPLHAAPLDEVLVARGVAWLVEGRP